MQEFDQLTENSRLITSRAEIVALLRSLGGARSTTFFSFPNSSTNFSGKITQVNPYFEEVIFAEDLGAGTKFPPGRELLVTVLSSVKAQFHAERLEPTEFEGKPAWRVRLPKTVYCSERRDSIRVSVPSDTPLEVLYLRPLGGETDRLVLPVVDIGEGGVAIMVNPLQLEARLGKELKNCLLNLPNVGDISFDLVVQNTTEISLSNAVSGRRCGCQFSRILPDDLVKIKDFVARNKA